MKELLKVLTIPWTSFVTIGIARIESWSFRLEIIGSPCSTISFRLKRFLWFIFKLFSFNLKVCIAQLFISSRKAIFLFFIFDGTNCIIMILDSLEYLVAWCENPLGHRIDLETRGDNQSFQDTKGHDLSRAKGREFESWLPLWENRDQIYCWQRRRLIQIIQKISEKPEQKSKKRQ